MAVDTFESLCLDKNTVSEGHITVSCTVLKNEKIQITAQDAVLGESDDVLVMVENQLNGKRYILPFERIDGSTGIVDLAMFKEWVSSAKRIRWNLHFGIQKGGVCTLMAMKVAEAMGTPIAAARRIFDFCYGDVTMSAVFYCTPKRNALLVTVDKPKLYQYQLKATVQNFTLKDKYLDVDVICPKDKESWCGFCVVYRNKRAEAKQEYFFAPEALTKEADGYHMRGHMDLSVVQFRRLYWDVYAVFEEDGERYYAGLLTCNEEVEQSFQSLFAANSYYPAGGDVLFPYMGPDNQPALMLRERSKTDGFVFRLKERIALRVFRRLKSTLKSKKIILVYEKYCQLAQDNGYYFFRYCMENNMEQKMNRSIYYVIDKKMPDYQRVEQYKGKVIQFMSLRHMIYLRAAALLVSSDSKEHAYVWRSKGSILRPLIDKKKLVFLQHGVTAMKKVDSIFKKGGGGTCNMFVATSAAEKEIICEHFQYQPSEVEITGFARWDVLADKSEGKNEILLMPTWRNWLDDAEDAVFRASEYYNNYMQLLTSAKLQEVLERYNLTLNFFIHPKFKEYIRDFQVEDGRIKVVNIDEHPLNELMMSCKLLITDYSSVCWDVLYMGKPVLFYQFDLDTYLAVHGSYIDMKCDLPGERTEDLNQLIDLVEKNASDGFVLQPQYEGQRKATFAYLDQDNTKRICDAIISRDW